MRNQNQLANTSVLPKILPAFVVTFSFCFCTMIGVGTTNADKPSVTFNKASKLTQNKQSLSIPRKKTGVGYPSPYSSNRSRSSFGSSSGPRVDFRGMGQGHSHNKSNYSRNNYGNRSSGGIYLSVSPRASSSYRGLGNSIYYRPTNGIRYGGSVPYGYGTSIYSSGSYVPYAIPSNGRPLNYSNQYQNGYLTPSLQPTTPSYSAAEAAARAELFGNSRLGASSTPTTINNQFYAKIPTSGSARSFQARSEQAFKSGDYAQAANLAEQALSLDSSNGKLRLFVSHTNFAIGNFSQAASHLDIATRSLPPEQWGYVVRQFRDFYGKNDYVSQTNRLSQNIASYPTANNYALRGYHYGSLGYVEAATADFKQALGINAGQSLSNRLLPVFGIAPQSLPPEEIQAPVPAAVPDGFIPLNQQSFKPADGIIRLVPQFTEEELRNAVPAPVPDLEGGILSTLEIPVDTGKSILTEVPGEIKN